MEYRGCKAVLAQGPTCILYPNPNRKLYLWVGAKPEAIEIRVGDQRIETAGETIREGQRFLIPVPSGVRRLEVLVETAHGGASWSLAIATTEGGRLRDALREVQEQLSAVDSSLRRRQLAAARKLLATLRLPRPAPAELRCQVSYHSAWLAEREGNYRVALEEAQRAVEIAERVKLDRRQWEAEQLLALIFRDLGRAGESAQRFERLCPTPPSGVSCVESPRCLNNQAWSALLAREAGEAFAEPAHLLEQAREEFASCKDASLEDRTDVELNLALAHFQAGRLRQAKDQLARAHRLEPQPTLPHALWWLDLEARIALLHGQPKEALRQFERLADLAGGAISSDGLLRAAFGRARCYQALHDPAAALEVLRKAETLVDEASRQISLSEGRETFFATRQTLVGLHVELLLDAGRAADALVLVRQNRSRMLRQLERRDRLASLKPETRARWDHLMAEYEAGRAALEERAKNDWGLPPDELHREQASRQAAAERLKKVLDQAFQLLGDVGEPAREQPPPSPGELILTYLPLPQRAEPGARHDAWVGFAAATAEDVTVHRFSLPADVKSLSKQEQARRLLHPFRTSIEKAKRIRILSSGPLQNVDFHELPFAGEGKGKEDVLLARCPVVYGLDLSVPRGPQARPGGHALLIADPRGDLPGALAEAQAVQKVLASGGGRWVVEELQGEEATEANVRGRLAANELVHYAGHGTFSGFGGWDSSLLLANETRLTLGDLLAFDHVPAWVVLSSCDTGRSSDEIPVESLGLAHAFLLAGSRAVVASTRPAFDRKVPELFADLYRRWDREPDLDLAVALQQAQLAWRERNPGADWSAFRLFVP